MIAYHFLKADMRAGQGLQKAWKVGETRTLKGGAVIPCARGFHGSPTAFDALQFAPGPMLCLVELRGDVTPHGNPVDKYVARSRKLIAVVNVERELRLFAADCAEHVLWIFEKEFPNDSRPRDAIAAARDRADAAGGAAWAAGAAADAAEGAWDATLSAEATGAARAAWAARGAWAAAGGGARAVWAVGGATDEAAEKTWQRAQFEARFGQLFPEEATSVAQAARAVEVALVAGKAAEVIYEMAFPEEVKS